MEAHPIPQNVTTFEFKLVGDMTLKQFTYLASGLSLAYLVFVFLAVPFPFLAWPLIAIFSFLGIAFAFLPLADRPLDHWVRAYLRAVYSPTQRRWQKNSQGYWQIPLFKTRLNAFLSTLTPPPQPLELPHLAAAKAPLPQPPSLPPPPTLPTEEELTKTVVLAKQAQILQIKIIEAEKELAGLKIKFDVEQFNAVFDNLQRLYEEASRIKLELSKVAREPQKRLGEIKVKVVTPPKPKPTQLQLTSLPNVINGIVTDSEGNYLEGAVVVIHDKDGLPVRALKTNRLGQFTGSTPLPNGIYTIELEKDNLVFDVLQIELSGAVLPPLNIAAKRLVSS